MGLTFIIQLDTSVTADELIPLLAFVIVQSNVPRLASLIYYMQYYRLARMVEGSVYRYHVYHSLPHRPHTYSFSLCSFVVTTMKTACEFLKDDPLSLNDASSVSSSISAGSLSTINLSPERSRSVSFGSASKFGKPNSAPPHHVNSARFSLNHRKSQSADLYGLTDMTQSEDVMVDIEQDRYASSSSNSSSRRNSAIVRPLIVLPNRHEENRRSLEIPNDWLLPSHTTTSSSGNRYKMLSRNLGLSKPMVTTTFPSISNSTPLPVDVLPHDRDPPMTTSSALTNSVIDIPKLGRSLSTSTVIKKKLSQPPKVINIRDRISFDGVRRPASICIDTRSLHSIEDGGEESEELMGDFLRGLSKLDGNVVGERTGSIKTFRRL